MKNKFYKNLLILGIISIVIIVLVFITFSFIKEKVEIRNENKVNELEVDFLDIGQGDSVLIQTTYGQNIIIDGGPDDSVLDELEKVLPWWDKKIDLMVLTHPHSDHVTGLIYVLDKYEIGKIMYTGVNHTAPGYLEWLEKIKNKNIEILLIDQQQKIELGKESFLEILYPNTSLLHKEIDNLNNTSVIVKLTHGETKFLFAGNAEKEIEKELLENKVDLNADVFKVSHHGSNDSNTEEFLKAISPKYAIIQVGKNNKFHHPHSRIIKRLERTGAKIFRNDVDGLVKVFSDGENIRID
ncbi:MBL fold metallo-hydrolase [Candidatus Parcubacteria bacterium]|nr:MBL fold metallo-hydrolase [Candidatus Parcubacteria bacterium]